MVTARFLLAERWDLSLISPTVHKKTKALLEIAAHALQFEGSGDGSFYSIAFSPSPDENDSSPNGKAN